MNKDMSFMEVFLSVMGGKSTSEAIEDQEQRGQRMVVGNSLLPKRVNDGSLPLDIRTNGVEKEMDWERRRELMLKNNMEYTAQQYKLMGIQLIEEHDDLFWSVILPDGWVIRPTDHSMWNELFDNKGRKRAWFFYKAAFYDRDAFIQFETRFHLSVDHIAPSHVPYEVWERSDYRGTIKDGDKVIFFTSSHTPTGSYQGDDALKKTLYTQLEEYMKEHYPDYLNIQAYWD